MPENLNFPKIEEFKHWFVSILILETNVEKLNIEQLENLKHYISYKNRDKREDLISILPESIISIIEESKNKVYSYQIEILNEEINTPGLYTEELDGLNNQLNKLKRYNTFRIDKWLDSYISTLDIPYSSEVISISEEVNIVPMEVTEEDEIQPFDLFLLDKDELYVMEIINYYIEDINFSDNFNKQNINQDCSELLKKNISKAVYGLMRFSGNKLNLELKKYSTINKAKDEIGNLMIETYPLLFVKWLKSGVLMSVRELYSALKNNSFNWDNLEGGVAFNNRYRFLKRLSDDDILKLKKCIENYKE